MYNNCCCDLVVYNKMWKTVNVSMPFPAYGMSSGVICGKLYVAVDLKLIMISRLKYKIICKYIVQPITSGGIYLQ